MVERRHSGVETLMFYTKSVDNQMVVVLSGRASEVRPLRKGSDLRYEEAPSKAVATARMYYLGGMRVRPLGPGSKEKKSSIQALGRFVGLDLKDVPTKAECGLQIADLVDAAWDDTCISAGDTVTLTGLNRLLNGAVSWALSQSGQMSSEAVQNLMSVEPAPRAAEYTREDEMSAEIDDLQDNIAGLISELTEVSETPDGVAPSASHIHSSQISFNDGSWRNVLTTVQDWLRVSLDTSSVDDFDGSLATGLGLDAAAGQMPSVLLPRLVERLERAIGYRERFLDQLGESSEGGATVGTATQAWIKDWDTAEEEQETEASGSIFAEADTWAIQEFVQRARDGALNLSPSYQRADVWRTPDSQLLIESVLRGIPLPSIILLASDPDDRGDQYEVVDGKQRLTSILRFIGRHPRAVELVERKAEEWGNPELIELFQRDYRSFRREWKKHSSQTLSAAVERELYFPFPLRSGKVPGLSGPLEPLKGKYYSEIRDIPIKVAGVNHKVGYVFEQTAKYKVPVIIYREATSEQVHDVFGLYNKQGKHLNAEEIRNALFHRLDLMLAVLVTAGDSPDMDKVAPFLSSDWDDLEDVGSTLENYGFGRTGYKRSKLLSWVLSILLHDAAGLAARSTASQINALFKGVDESKPHLLRDKSIVTLAMVAFHAGLQAHASIDDGIWAPKFKNSLGAGKWQELQLVPALVSFTAAFVVLGDDLDNRIDDNLSELTRRSAHWIRPKKTQTKLQWQFIAHVTRELLDILGVDPIEADAALTMRFGKSGLKHLLEIAPLSDED